ncbi:MFS transporter [Kibdelosporangium aridum]|uniref:Predicted arabinose efflux permease, MFS family n=1 Tax=Kibdelosporangium aridum TaxID=2030 RepID=A0A1W2FNA9_KIBAR|nr:MFS transporter [Kibdelosporangium aridum]SMD23469.1 Predicted arabinose efflux permease, MFS family [Kibdelosporangium aridum]
MSLFRHHDFRLLWASDTISQFGTFVGQTVLPLVAVTVLAATPFEMGLLTAAETAAFLLIGLPAGVWVDRMRRRTLMVRADIARAVLMLSIPVAWWADVLTLPHMIVVGLLVGVCTVFFDVSYQSYLPTLVNRDQLLDGNAKLQASQQVALVSGPAAGGGLATLIGAANATAAVGVGFVASWLFLLRIKKVEPQPERKADRRLRDEVWEGLKFLFHNKMLRAIALTGTTAGFFFQMETAAMILFLAKDLHLNAAQVGLVLAVGGFSGALGAVTSNWWYRKIGNARAMWVSLLAIAPFELLIPLAQPGWMVWLIVIGMLGVGYGVTVHNIAQVSFRQSICPDRLLGRMNASMRFMIWGAFPLGSLAGGVLGELITVRGTLWVAAVGLSLSWLWLIFSPIRTTVRTPSPTTVDPAGHEQPAPQGQ